MSRSASLALAVVLLAGVAHAQPRDVAKADALFKEGRALMKNGDYETACPKLEESYRLDPAPGTGINLGDCLEKQGKVASALLAYQAARALLKPGDPRIGPVEKEIAALDKRAPRLTIKLAPGAPEGTTVKRDGREVEASKLRVALPVNPGEHWIVVVAPGRADSRTRVKIAEGTSRTVVVGAGEAERGGDSSQERAPTPAPDARSREPQQDSTLTTVGYIAIAVGALAVGYGVVSAFEWKKEKDDFDSECGDGLCADYDDRKDKFESARSNTLLGLAGGGVLLVGGAAIVFLVPTNTTPASGPPTAPRASRFGLQYQGTW